MGLELQLAWELVLYSRRHRRPSSTVLCCYAGEARVVELGMQAESVEEGVGDPQDP